MTAGSGSSDSLDINQDLMKAAIEREKKRERDMAKEIAEGE